MGKKKVKNAVGVESLASRSVPILEIEFSEPLFAFACHPENPILACGLASGHVFCYKYDADLLEEHLKVQETNSRGSKADLDTNKATQPWVALNVEPDARNETSGVDLLWKTKRHKGSVRSIFFEADGSFMYSVGSDGVLKKANTENGKVVKKIDLTETISGKCTKGYKSSTHSIALIGDEGGNVTVLDTETLAIKNVIRGIHNGDAINDIFQFSKRSAHKFISLGQTTLAYWDSRESNEQDFQIVPGDTEAKRKVLLSDDQEDEILCGTFVNPEDGESLVCGLGEGVLTVWKPKKNDLADQITRIKVKKNESLDCVVPTLQDDNCVWAGCSDGQVYKVNVKNSKVVEFRKHCSDDEVVFLDLDYDYRLVSGGMDVVKIWQLNREELSDQAEAESQDESSGTDTSDKESEEAYSDSEDSSNESASSGEASSMDDEVWDKLEDGNDANSGANSDSSSEGQSIGLSREELINELDKDIYGEESAVDVAPSAKRRKTNEIDPKSAAKLSKKQKRKQEQLTAKQLRNLQKHEHGIKRFDDL
ncbi:LAMI_0G07360g1_1 [Lachancea mirantina]|uniref:WD repeat-containing protein JIP5 n=1 Tax=Lachancea mirantina TaxID=1230905 RepID=A0A1G4K9M0_9SACH|nr:LAMI_0G07360g1_1 [Lachancea mirantina]